ncbi:hypothetical protein [Mucilaginibacter gynuensis]|uniref:hypothetical protein n=1 Tax=Mucilaginibacter gynuensis TaxID=1302236 RepID=UPI0031EE2F31
MRKAIAIVLIIIGCLVSIITIGSVVALLKSNSDEVFGSSAEESGYIFGQWSFSIGLALISYFCLRTGIRRVKFYQS